METLTIVTGLLMIMFTDLTAGLRCSRRLSGYPWDQTSQDTDMLCSPTEKHRAQPVTLAPAEFPLFQKLRGKVCWRSHSVSRLPI